MIRKDRSTKFTRKKVVYAMSLITRHASHMLLIKKIT